MPLRQILDATAQVCAGTTPGDAEGEFRGAGGITGVKLAHSLMPERIKANLSVVCFPISAVIENGNSSGLQVITHTIEIRLYVQSRQGANLHQLMKSAVPFEELFRCQFRKHVALKGTCQSAMLTGYRYGSDTYAGVEHLIVAFTLVATEKPSVTYSADDNTPC